MVKRTTHNKDKVALTVPDKSILINCMTPCSKCEIVKKFITSSMRNWVKKLGYTLVYNSQTNKTANYWQTYGKFIKVGQATPQIYVVKTQTEVAGAMINPGEKIGNMVVPDTSKWNTTMLKDIIKSLIQLV